MGRPARSCNGLRGRRPEPIRAGITASVLMGTSRKFALPQQFSFQYYSHRIGGTQSDSAPPFMVYRLEFKSLLTPLPCRTPPPSPGSSSATASHPARECFQGGTAPPLPDARGAAAHGSPTADPSHEP